MQRLELASGDDSTAPQLTSFAGRVVLSWVDRADTTDTVRYAEWEGGRWTAPRSLVTSDNLFVNAADVPSVARVSSSLLVGQWLENTNPELEAYDLRLAVSRDQGATWAPPMSPHHDGKEVQHGFASLFAGPAETWGVVWLDGRRMDPHAMHRKPPTDPGEMDLMSATFDASGKQTSETRLDTRVCDCCPTSLAATASGVVLAFRDRSTEEVRDIATARLDKGTWSAPSAVAADNWRIEACPVNGPAIAADGDRVVVAWFTAAGNRGRVQLAFSTDGARSFSSPIDLGDSGVRGRVDAAMLADGTAAVTWVAVENERSRAKLVRISPSGDRSPTLTLAGGEAELLGYPKLERADSGLLATWAENQGFSRVVSARIDVSTTPDGSR